MGSSLLTVPPPCNLGILSSQEDGGRPVLEHKAFLIQGGRGTLSRVHLSNIQQLVLVKKRSQWDPEPQDISRKTLLSKVGQQVSFIFASQGLFFGSAWGSSRRPRDTRRPVVRQVWHSKWRNCWIPEMTHQGFRPEENLLFKKRKEAFHFPDCWFSLAQVSSWGRGDILIFELFCWRLKMWGIKSQKKIMKLVNFVSLGRGRAIPTEESQEKTRRDRQKSVMTTFETYISTYWHHIMLFF